MLTKKKTITILDKVIGEDHPTFIIAEAGINHNGKLNLAKKLIDVAVNANADAVKFQTAKAEDVVVEGLKIPTYAKKNMKKNITQQEMIKKIELSEKEFRTLKEYCDTKGIIFLSTPHSFTAIDVLEALVPAYKFGSGDLTNFRALAYAASKKKPMLLGTGMATVTEVKAAIKTIKEQKNNNIVALHCTTSYPCPLEEVNLRSMVTMSNELDCLVGYSDHTLGVTVPVIAASLGACVIEKHITLNKQLPGPDHKASLEPNELCNMVQLIRQTEQALGSSKKKPTASEQKIMSMVRKSLVAKRFIKKDTIISKDMLEIKRPGSGIPPLKFDTMVGKKAKKDIQKDTILQWDMIK